MCLILIYELHKRDLRMKLWSISYEVGMKIAIVVKLNHVSYWYWQVTLFSHWHNIVLISMSNINNKQHSVESIRIPTYLIKYSKTSIIATPREETEISKSVAISNNRGVAITEVDFTRFNVWGRKIGRQKVLQ